MMTCSQAPQTSELARASAAPQCPQAFSRPRTSSANRVLHDVTMAKEDRPIGLDDPLPVAEVRPTLVEWGAPTGAGTKRFVVPIAVAEALMFEYRGGLGSLNIPRRIRLPHLVIGVDPGQLLRESLADAQRLGTLGQHDVGHEFPEPGGRPLPSFSERNSHTAPPPKAARQSRSE